MGGVNGVSHQHHVAAPIEVGPLFAFDTLKIQPRRAPQVARVGHQFRTLQITRKDFFAKCDGLVLIGLV